MTHVRLIVDVGILSIVSSHGLMIIHSNDFATSDTTGILVRFGAVVRHLSRQLLVQGLRVLVDLSTR